MNTAQHFFGSYFGFFFFLSFYQFKFHKLATVKLSQLSNSTAVWEQLCNRRYDTLDVLQRKQKENYISELTQGVADGMLYLKYVNYAA